MKLDTIAEHALSIAKRCGAQQSAARVERARTVSVGVRDGNLADISESTSTRFHLELFVDGRYSSNVTSDLRKPALEAFVTRCFKTTQLLKRDPARGLADPSLYDGRPERDLQLYDPRGAALSLADRKLMAQEISDGTRSVRGPIQTAASSFRDTHSIFLQLLSNGFQGSEERSEFSLSPAQPATTRRAESRSEGPSRGLDGSMIFPAPVVPERGPVAGPSGGLDKRS